MRPGHGPTPFEIEGVWTLEGTSLVDGVRQRLRVTLDRDAGTVIEVSDAEGDADLVFDDDHLVTPGFLDLHVHCRDDPGGAERYKEDFESASRAALHGGVVAVGDMPNNPEPPVDPESLARKRAVADERAAVDVILYGAVTEEGGPFADGIPYKCYYGPSIGNLHLRTDARSVTPLARFGGRFVAFHAESHEILEASRGAGCHEDRRPPEAEVTAIAEILSLAREHGFRPHIAHLSTADGLAEIRTARRDGVGVTCEVAPHHLFFDRDNRARFRRGEWLQMNPPLRRERDRRALLDGLATGEVDMIATDHAPHSLEENRTGVSGVPNLDTFGAFLTWLAENESFAWETLIDRASAAPARIFREFLPGRLGELVPGGVGSLTVIHTRSPWCVEPADLCTRAGWSPFEGVEFPGHVAATVVRGRPYVMR